MSSTSKLRRRDVLRGLVTTSLTLPFLRPLAAYSQDATAPKRVLFWFQPNGCLADLLFPTGPARQFASGSDLSPTLAALEPWLSKVNVIDNVKNYSSYHEPLRVAPHDQGCCELWTNQACEPAKDGVSFTHGGDFDTWSWPKGPSIDQFLADQEVVRGSTPVRSLELGVQVSGAGTNRRMSYTSEGTPVAPDNDPRSVIQRMFGGIDLTDNQAADRAMRNRQRILDRVSGDLNRLSTRLDAADRQTLDRYATAIDELEKEVTSMHSAAECVIPTDDGSVTDLRDNLQIPAIGRLQMKALAASFACDLTRVGSLMWMGSEPTNRMTWLTDDGRNNEYHLCSHLQLSGIPSETQSRWLAETDKWFVSQVAFFLQELETLDPTGELLNNTLVVCANELSHGNAHSRDRLPFVTVGGDWYFKTGYYRKYSEERRHGDLLAEISRCMGADIDTFGNPEYCDGPSLALTTEV